MVLTLPFKSTNLKFMNFTKNHLFPLKFILLDTVMELIMTVTMIQRAALVTTDMGLSVSTTAMAIPAPITPIIMDRGHLDFENLSKEHTTKLFLPNKHLIY